MHVLGWVLYDSSCGFCARWIPFWSTTLRRRGFAIAPLQSPWVQQQLGVPVDELLKDLRLLLADGRQVCGADVYRYVMKRIWWAYPFYLLAIAPGLWRVFDWSYRTFANNRYRISRTCRLSTAGSRRTIATATHTTKAGETDRQHYQHTTIRRPPPMRPVCSTHPETLPRFGGTRDASG